MTFLGSSWSADGNWLAGRGFRDGLSVREGIFVYSFAEEKYSKLSSMATDAGSVSWMPDSRHVVVAAGNRLFALDRVTLATTEIFESERYGVAFPSVAADGSMIYFLAVRPESDIWMATVE